MKASTSIVLLPGMDGTGRLFAGFIQALPTKLRPSPVAYSTTAPETYDDLEALVRAEIRTIATIQLSQTLTPPQMSPLATVLG